MGPLTPAAGQITEDLMKAVRHQVVKNRLERLGFDVSNYRPLREPGIELSDRLSIKEV